MDRSLPKFPRQKHPPKSGAAPRKRPLSPEERLCRIAFLAALILAVFVAGALVPEEALAVNFSRKALPPSLRYPFGTDWLGRNLFLRTLKGLSLSVRLGLISSGISAVLATLMGAAAAAGKSRLDSAVNWLIDLVMGIPHLVLLILISFACGRGLTGLLAGISLTHWTSLARLLRGEILQLRERDYVLVSKRLGHGSGWILLHHFLPHLLPQFLVGLVLIFPHAILHESALSFLGYGLPPEQPAIGIILSESTKYLTGGMWWSAIFPGISLVFAVLIFDRLGELLKP